MRSFVDAKADLCESDVTQVATVGFSIVTSHEAAADYFAQVGGWVSGWLAWLTGLLAGWQHTHVCNGMLLNVLECLITSYESRNSPILSKCSIGYRIQHLRSCLPSCLPACLLTYLATCRPIHLQMRWCQCVAKLLRKFRSSLHLSLPWKPLLCLLVPHLPSM